MISTQEANILIGLRLGNRTASAPETWYFGISTSTISSDGSGITEPSGDSGYKRVAIQNNSTNFTSPTDGKVQNATPIEMPEIKSDSGVATDFFLSTSASGGQAAYYGTFETPRPMPAQSNLTINAKDATFQVVSVK